METTFVVENTRACRHEKPRKTSVRVLAALCCLVMSTLANTQTGRSPRLAPLGRHAYDASASSCNGNSILFYNADTGEGAIGKVSADGFRTTKTYPPGAFAKAWTHAVRVDALNSILFYKQSTGDAAVGNLMNGEFKTNQTYNNFARGWTNILYAGLHGTGSLPLFYNAANGTGALGFSPSEREYPKGAFASGWTHIVWNDSGILFYNTYDGSGAVAVPFASKPQSPHIVDDIKTTKTFPAGAFSTDWTHVVATGSSVLFYNYADGAGAVGRLTPSSVGGANGFVTDKTYAPKQFAPHWTHAVGAAEGLILFYNSSSGEGAVGQIAGNQFVTSKVYPKDAFAHGFTHLVCAEDPPPTGPPH